MTLSASYRPLSQREKLVYNGGFKFLTAVIHKKQDRRGSNFARPWLQGMLNYVTEFFQFGLFIPVFENRHYAPVVCLLC